MSYRFTNTEKWNDSWFSVLTKNQKLLFLYLCDNCDIAGFIEINLKRWQADLDFNSAEIKGAVEGLSRGLITSESNDCIFIRNFLKHQKNLPLNEKNNAHIGIIKRFGVYRNKFKIENIESFINQEVKPLARGYGKGNGIGIDEDILISDEDFLKAKNYLLSLFDKKYVTDKNVNTLIKLKLSYDPRELHEAIIWATSDDFWKPNFLSPSKLIQKNKDGVKFIDVFIAKSKQAKKPTQPKPQSITDKNPYHVIQ